MSKSSTCQVVCRSVQLCNIHAHMSSASIFCPTLTHDQRKDKVKITDSMIAMIFSSTGKPLAD